MALSRLKFTGIISRCPAKHILKFRSCKKVGCPFATCENPRKTKGCDEACHSQELFNLDHLLVKMPINVFKYYPYWLHQEEILNLSKLASHFGLHIDIGEGNDYHEDAICVTITKKEED